MQVAPVCGRRTWFVCAGVADGAKLPGYRQGVSSLPLVRGAVLRRAAGGRPGMSF